MNHHFSFLNTESYAKWIILAAFFILMALILATYGTLFYPTKLPLPEALRLRVQEVHFEGSKGRDLILEANLFGIYVPQHLDDGLVKQSLLDWTVVGILFSKDESQSQVIIRSAKGEEEAYGMEDELPQGVFIKKITPEGILIERGGLLERLNLPKNTLIFEPIETRSLKQEL